jgi:hypothetical protein
LFEEGYLHPGGANGHLELIQDFVIFSGFGTSAIDREVAGFGDRGRVFRAGGFRFGEVLLVGLQAVPSR